MLGGSPAFLFLSCSSLFLVKPRGHCSLTRRKKSSGTRSLGNRRQKRLGAWVCGWGWAAHRAGQAGELHARVAQMALPASVCILKLQSWSVLCRVKDEKPFQKGCVACTPICYCALWTHQPKSGLNWATLHFVLFCHFDMPSVYRCHDSSTKYRRFTSLLLFLCQYIFEVYLPRLQYIKH